MMHKSGCCFGVEQNGNEQFKSWQVVVLQPDTGVPLMAIEHRGLQWMQVHIGSELQ